MKFQPKRFVVEVKRGTSRAAFASPDPASDRFSSAEALLFGGTAKSEAKTERASSLKGEPPGGRVLRSLVEPPPPVVEEPALPVRRGRKPGSKNKPKVLLIPASPTESDSPGERPRRGRKPGSKNKPKPLYPSTTEDGPSSLADMMRNYGFADDDATPQDAAASNRDEPNDVVRTALEAAPRLGRTRLRDRSSILKRYVLDTEPRPGQPGAIRARRIARAAHA